MYVEDYLKLSDTENTFDIATAFSPAPSKPPCIHFYGFHSSFSCRTAPNNMAFLDALNSTRSFQERLGGRHIVVAGNPGVGKSALLNCLARKTLFRSGVNLARGLTESLQTETIGDVTLSDTPGLDDVNIRERAAGEISKVIRKGGRLTIIFVITLEAGRLRPADKAVIKTILDAIKKLRINTDYKYSILVNKCEADVLSMLQSDKEGRTILESVLGVGKEFSHIAYMPNIPDASREADALIRCKPSFLQFISDAPEMPLRPDNNASVLYEGYSSLIEKLEILLKNLEEDVKRAILRQRTTRPMKTFMGRVKIGSSSALQSVVSQLLQRESKPILV